MVDFYVRRIKKGKMDLSEVPTRWHDAVLVKLEDEDY